MDASEVYAACLWEVFPSSGGVFELQAFRVGLAAVLVIAWTLAAPH